MDINAIFSSRIKHSTHLLALFGSLLFTLGLRPYSYGTDDQAITVPFLMEKMLPGTFSNDALIDQIPYYTSLFWDSIGIIAKVTGMQLELLFFLLHSLALYFTFYFILSLSRILFQSDLTQILTLFLVVFFQRSLGGFELISQSLSNRISTLPLALFALLLLLKKRLVAASLILSIVFILHPLTGLYFWVFFLGSSLLDKNLRQMTKLLKLHAPFLIVAVSFALIKMNADASPQAMVSFWASEQWLEIQKMRSAHHLFPSTWNFMDTAHKMSILLMGLILWLTAKNNPYQKVMIGGYAAIILLLIFNFIFTVVVPNSLVIQTTMMRASTLLMLFSIITTAGVFSELLLKNNITKSTAASLLIFLIIYNYDSLNFIMPWVALTWGLTIILLLAYSKAKKKALLIASIVVLVLSTTAMSWHLNKISGGFKISSRQDGYWRDMQHYVKGHTDKEALIIVPPEKSGFRIEGERSIYGDLKDGTIGLFNEQYSMEWWQRMQQVGVKYESGKLVSQYTTLKADDFVQISAKHKEKYTEIYAVTVSLHEIPEFPMLYDNGRFRIYRVL
ncbi:MAG TPA: hypothetical protein DDX92_00270 [Flavobacteriales bacterium]|jgi:hypothetical protein|nr:hypothetical protein [Flavobacteriales bacterium]